MAYRREIFTIARAKQNRNGKTYWKGVLDMGGKKVSITVYPSESGENAKISAWPWTGGMGNRYNR